MLQKKIDLAQNALKNKDFNKAKKLFEEVVSINPKLPAVYNILGNIELNFGNLNESVTFFQKAILHFVAKHCAFHVGFPKCKLCLKTFLAL